MKRLLSLLLVLTLANSARGETPEPPADRGIAGDLKFLGELVVDDTAAVLSSPFRMDRRGVMRLGGVLAVSGVLFAFDEEINDLVQRNEEEEPFDSVRRVGNSIENVGLMGKTWPYYLGATAVGYAVGNTTLTRIGGEILLAQYISGGLRNLGKLALGRRRPNEGRGAYFFEFNGGTSLPSGHAASAFAAAEVLAHHADRGWATAALYSLASAVALQRLSTESHWASDVWLGSISGMASARLITRRHDSLVGDSGDRGLGPTLSPAGDPGIGWHSRF